MTKTCKKLYLDTITAEDLVDSADTAAEEGSWEIEVIASGSDACNM